MQRYRRGETASKMVPKGAKMAHRPFKMLSNRSEILLRTRLRQEKLRITLLTDVLNRIATFGVLSAFKILWASSKRLDHELEALPDPSVCVEVVAEQDLGSEKRRQSEFLKDVSNRIGIFEGRNASMIV